MKRFCAQVLVCFGLSVLPAGAAISLSKDGYHVFPGDQIQDALQLAAKDETNKVVITARTKQSDRSELLSLRLRHQMAVLGEGVTTSRTGLSER